MNPSLRHTVGTALPLAIALAGCGSPRMAVPADVVTVSEELVISDRSSWSGALADESFQLGPFAIADVDRDWNSTSEVGVLGFSQGETTGGFSYKTEGGGASLVGACTSAVKQRSMDLGDGLSVGDEKQSVGCYCRQEDALAYFSVRATTTSEYTGELAVGPTRYRIRGIYERESGPDSSDPTGYRVDSDAGPIGAVDVLKPGRVWISRTLSAGERAPLACLLAGLLLYMPPSHNFD